jgi:DNA-binding response OmpR family regulator
MLMADGYEVRPAINGELALRSAFADPPEIVLLDIQMPGMDGYEVCRRLKAEPETRDIPVLFLSAYSEWDEKLKGFSLGAVDYLTKPCQRAELLARVGTHIALARCRKDLEAERASLETRVRERTLALEERSRELESALAALSHRERE